MVLLLYLWYGLGLLIFAACKARLVGELVIIFKCWEVYHRGVEVYLGSLAGGVSVPEDDGVEVMMCRGVLASMEVRWFWIGVVGWCCADGYAEGHRV